MSATATGRSNGRRRNGRPPLIEREWDVYVCPDPELAVGELVIEPSLGEGVLARRGGSTTRSSTT
jgi:hypothetical protein